MKKPKSIFYIVYFLFHVLLLGVAIYVNYRSEDFEFLLKLRANMTIMIYAAVAGMILFIINMVIITMEVRNHKQKKEKLENEVNSLKAKMFDLEHASSTPAATSSEESSEEGSSDTFRDKE
ncbi:hypothetical protein E1176_18445 [Fulvivirga sp. RKSG066]|uniref:hypothetical protein n=1 Tax=Fulvivirga aurantia TaxID=2529383 RepID=UPI0012BC8E13|nr:hypothetical protein [Fulvivirga aurantia]MTI23017.1 hypothetical protein [Fulvivirga aurantia]